MGGTMPHLCVLVSKCSLKKYSVRRFFNNDANTSFNYEDEKKKDKDTHFWIIWYVYRFTIGVVDKKDLNELDFWNID